MVYGYVESRGRINLERLGAEQGADSISDILIVWTAKHPQGGIYIIGWYNNATVYRDYQDASDMPTRKYKDEYLSYNAVARATDAKLLPEDERTFPIPRGNGGKGQANVWYCDDPNMISFREKVLDYIETGQNKYKRTSNTPRQANIFLRQEIECVAIQKVREYKVREYYEGLGYLVESVEGDNAGWDLDIKKDKIVLNVEVKGLSGEKVSVELTPNEYCNMMRRKNSYRLAVVTNCIEDPHLDIFSYSSECGCWKSVIGVSLKIEEIISAKCSAQE